MKLNATFAALILAAGSMLAAQSPAPQISGSYLEVRSCDVYTGPCFANGEMGLAGKEAVMVWSVGQGHWKGVALDGLNVIVVVKTDDTMGDLHYQPRCGPAILITDSKANAKQKDALSDFAKSMAGKLINEVVDVKTADMDVALGTCAKSGCATVKAGNLVEISTRCLSDKDHVCGNEEAFYPPLTQVTDPYPAFTELAAFKGKGLNLTWQMVGKRSAFLGAFSK
jgi:hypothetical protein